MIIVTPTVTPDKFDFLSLYEQIKFWIPIACGMFAVFRGVEWVRSVRTEDIPEIQKSIKGLNDRLDDQTNKIVGELKELRADFRILLIPQVQPVMVGARAKPVRTRKKKDATTIATIKPVEELDTEHANFV